MHWVWVAHNSCNSKVGAAVAWVHSVHLGTAAPGRLYMYVFMVCGATGGLLVQRARSEEATIGTVTTTHVVHSACCMLYYIVWEARKTVMQM